jgi:hypothetical protein
MFNFFPKFGSPSDSTSPEEIVNKANNLFPTWTWSTGIKDADGKDVPVTELIQKYNALVNENKNLNDLLKSIEEDGTEEHNNAIKLREENVELKKGNKYWEEICKMKTDHIYDLMKEVNDLRHLKEENVKLIEEKAALLDKGGLTYKDA